MYAQHQNPYANYPGHFSLAGLYGAQRPTTKRALMDSAPIGETRPSKKARTDDADGPSSELPDPDSFPTLHDDGTKPQHSYAQLIGMSILRAPNRRLTLAQIYKWISDTFSFYNAQEAGWQNSIRHNLSLNKAFIKQERPKDDPGKGNYWAIQAGMEIQFIKEKPSRKAAGPNESLPPTALAPPSESTQPIYKPLTPALRHDVLPGPIYSQPEPLLPAISEASSDATIPASDSFIQDEEKEEEELEAAPPSSPLLRSSPPIAMMNSSPPVARHASRRNDTPPPVPRFPSSSQNRSHKRKFASMDDSGYFSSLESSAMRPHVAGRLLTSEADRPRIKRGRAEEEIARLRGSSYDSPAKTRSMSSFAAAVSSSPLRPQRTHSQMLPPITPAVKLKAPIRPPLSVSPNTNLRLHRDRVRQLVGSPIRGTTSAEENLPWSPAFRLETDYSSMFQDYVDVEEFSIFADSNQSLAGHVSPEKRSAKRPRLDRSRSANVLADLSNASANKTPTPKLDFTPMLAPSPTKGFSYPESPVRQHSPLKMEPLPVYNPFDISQEDFYGAEFLSEDFSDFPGLDIMQGFQKIGSGNSGQTNHSVLKSTSRPSIARSSTSLF